MIEIPNCPLRLPRLSPTGAVVMLEPNQVCYIQIPGAGLCLLFRILVIVIYLLFVI